MNRFFTGFLLTLLMLNIQSVHASTCTDDEKRQILDAMCGIKHRLKIVEHTHNCIVWKAGECEVRKSPDPTNNNFHIMTIKIGSPIFQVVHKAVCVDHEFIRPTPEQNLNTLESIREHVMEFKKLLLHHGVDYTMKYWGELS